MTTPVVRTHYDKIASVYDDRWRRYLERTISFAVEGVTFSGTEAVLDIACGTGELERRLLDVWPNVSITAIDLCPAMLEHARQKPFADKVNWTESDVTKLPYSDNSFDYVFCVNAFHYFREPRDALSECQRVLRPSGSLHIVDWCDDYFMCKLCSMWLRLTNPAFYRTYTLKNCRSMLADAGFRIVCSQRRRLEVVWGMMSVTANRCP